MTDDVDKDQLVALYEASLALERDVWARTGGFLPGHPKHDPQVWERWLFCVGGTAAAARALRDAFAPEPKHWWSRGKALPGDATVSKPPSTWPSSQSGG